MRIVSIGTFLLPVRLSLTNLMDSERDAITSAIRREFAEFTVLQQADPTELLLDQHRSTGARQVETMLFTGTMHNEDLGAIQLYLSGLSIGIVVVEFELPDGTVVDLESTGSRQDFKGYEATLFQHLGQQVEPRVFYTEWQGKVLYVFGTADRDAEWRGVFLADAVPGEKQETVVAKRGRLRVEITVLPLQ